MGRRTLLLIAALVVAALGTVLVFLYAQNAQNAAQQEQQLVSVVVAKTQIAPGTSGSAASNAGAFETKQVPNNTLVTGALSDIAPLNDLVALTTIYPGQQIIAQQWGSAAQITGLPLPSGKIAFSLQLGDPQRVAGFVVPGSTVAIFAVDGPNVRTLLKDITVIGVGSTALNAVPTASGQQQTSSAILTLAVTQSQAERLIVAQGRIKDADYTNLWFALMDKNSKVVEGDSGTDNKNLFPTVSPPPAN